MIHTHTPATSDVRTWLDNEFPEGDVTVAHTPDCDRQSCGDECQGGCPVIDPRPRYEVVCFECGQRHEAEYSHEGRFGEGPIYAVVCTEDYLTSYYTSEVVEEVAR